MSTPGEDEMRDRLVESWAARIVASSPATVEAILTHSENVHDALIELAPHGRRTRQMLALRSGLSRPMMSKLETIGRRAELMRRVAGALPPSVVSLYILARQPLPEFNRALTMDLRSKSCAEIKALFALPSPARPTRKLMTILVPSELDEHARRLLIADITSALDRIIEKRKIDLEVSLPRHGMEGAAPDGAGTSRETQQTEGARSFEDHCPDQGEDACERDNGQGDIDMLDEGAVAEPQACADLSGKHFFANRPGEAVAHEPHSEPPGQTRFLGEIALLPSRAHPQFFTDEKIAGPEPAPVASATDV